jgi:uncharacterized protein (TIGR03437 family)
LLSFQRIASILMLCATPLAAQPVDLKLTPIAGELSRPVDIQRLPEQDGQMLFVLQEGRVVRFADGAILQPAFLDIRDRVRSGGERGLLGLAFPPGITGTRYFYVNYTNLAGNTVVSRIRRDGDTGLADPSTERILLTISQPFSNHNGGQIQFGPDGYLYIATGDGGSGGDPRNNAQNRQSLLGKILRIDVEPDRPSYGIPPDNPFINDNRFRPEIWAMGLRNPWRFSFDRATGDLWIGDVGQSRAEEIDFQPAASPGGENYGWRLMEGLECFNPTSCSPAGLTLPILEYRRNLGVSVTGGYVYRGAASPGVRGTYLFGDFGSGRIWGVWRTAEGWASEMLLNTNIVISTFGEDHAGEIYLADYSGGTIYRIDASGAPALDASQITNGASFVPGITPGSATTAFLPGLLDQKGVLAADETPLPESIGGVRISVDGVAGPLYSLANTAGNEQANFQAPFELAGRTTTVITIEREGHFEVSTTVNVLPEQPGVFTADGEAAIIVHHADNSLATAESPLRAGENAYFYATGLGPVSNAPATRSSAPASPLAVTISLPEVTIDGIPCEVQFAGLAPGFVGVYQVNIRIPDGLQAGARVLVIRISGSRSPGATVYLG